jgi:hypothetical protein
LLGALSGVALFLWPGEALPCACCAYPGQWSVSPAVFPEHRDWFVRELRGLQLSGTLESAEHGKGSEILSQRFEVRARFENDVWLFSVSRPGTTESMATLTLSSGWGCKEFKSDVGRRDKHGEVELYKELRFVGLLQSDSRDMPVVPGDATLVLQGYGNNCVDVGAFIHWVINFEVEGPGIIKEAVRKPAIRERVTAYGAVQTGTRR